MENNTNGETNTNSETTENTTNNWNDILSITASFIAILASIFIFSNKLNDYTYSVNAEVFYKTSPRLFFEDNLFGFWINIFILGINILVLISPFIIGNKIKDKKNSFFEYILIAAYISILIIILNISVIITVISKKISYENVLCYKIIITLIFLLLTYLDYYCLVFPISNNDDYNIWKNIKQSFQPLTKYLQPLLDKFKKNKTKKNRPKNKSKCKEICRKYKKQRIYAIYIIIMLIILYIFIFKYIRIPSMYPANEKSYEILKVEDIDKDNNEIIYDVIVGYKDKKAIIIKAKILNDGNNKTLEFVSDEYKLQDINNKVIIYETFKQVIPFEDSGSYSGGNGKNNIKNIN